MVTDLLNHIDRLIKQRPHSKEALTSYRELIVRMSDVETGPEKIRIEDRLKGIKREEGFPLFSSSDLPVDFETCSKTLSQLLEYLKDRKREDREGVKKAFSKSKEGVGWTEKLFRAVLNKDHKTLSEIGSGVDLNPKTLDFLTRVALKPSLSSLRHSLSNRIEKKGWDYGYCPLCGSQPNMAYFDKTGKRVLHCELCGEEWPYPRLNCPFCQNQDHKTLGYFQSEEEEGFRVDFCRKCQRYIKTLDKRVFEESAPMELEDLVTIHLDFLANEHGFK